MKIVVNFYLSPDSQEQHFSEILDIMAIYPLTSAEYRKSDVDFAVATWLKKKQDEMGGTKKVVISNILYM